MELKLYWTSLTPKGQNYDNRFQLKLSDFDEPSQLAIKAVWNAGGSAIFYETAGNYVVIVE